MNGVAPAFCAGLALWCSCGTIGITAPSVSARVALLPPWWLLPILAASIFAAIRFLHLSAREQAPLLGSSILLLPWLPVPIPAALLLWTGPFALAIWLAVLSAMAFARADEQRVHAARWLVDRRRAPIAAASFSFLIFVTSAWWLSPILPDGDEPHYLILAQSLIKDGDLRIENNHRRGDYLEYSLNAAAPDYLRRGVNGEIYSIHAPGLAVIVAPAMWLFGYPGVIAWLALLAAVSAGVLWYVAHRVAGTAGAAWFAWACCALTTPFLFQATEVFPDGVAATCLLLGTLPLTFPERQEGRTTPANGTDTVVWFLSGASLAVLPWLQTRLAVVAIAAAVCVAFRLRSFRQLLWFAGVPAASAAVWFLFFLVVYGTPNPTAPYGPYTQTGITNATRGLPGLLFDQQFGLVSNAPVYGFVLAGILASAARGRRWAWETLVLVMPYSAAVGSYQMWWGGTSVPARLLTSITLILGVAAARVWQDARTQTTKAFGLLALVVSLVIAMTLLGPDHGRLLLNFRDGISLWLEWANRVVDLPKALPSVFRDSPAHLWLKTLMWAASLSGAWLVARLVAPVFSWQSIWCIAVATMTACTLAWRVDGAQPLTPATAQLDLLAHVSGFRTRALDFRSWQIQSSATLQSNMRIEPDHQRRPAASPALFSARDVPAGGYELRVDSRQTPAGTLIVHAGSTTLPFRRNQTAVVQRQPAQMAIRLATGVRSLVVEGDDEAVRSVDAVELVPEPALGTLDTSVAESAHRAAHYETFDVFFLDENAYPEPTGFWVAGGRTATVVVSGTKSGVSLFVRNAPLDNRVTINVDGHRQDLMLAGGEERLISLPDVNAGDAVRVRLSAQTGFRPSTTEPDSTDQRYLGCWIEMR